MDAPEVDWALGVTMTQAVLDNWCRVVKGVLHSLTDVAHTADLQTDPGVVIASNLNNVIMNAGTAWNDAAGVSPLVIDDPTQGYLAPSALVSWPIILLFGIFTAATLAMGLH
jgi:hypothetical protein